METGREYDSPLSISDINNKNSKFNQILVRRRTRKYKAKRQSDVIGEEYKKDHSNHIYKQNVDLMTKGIVPHNEQSKIKKKKANILSSDSSDDLFRYTEDKTGKNADENISEEKNSIVDNSRGLEDVIGNNVKYELKESDFKNKPITIRESKGRMIGQRSMKTEDNGNDINLPTGKIKQPRKALLTFPINEIKADKNETRKAKHIG